MKPLLLFGVFALVIAVVAAELSSDGQLRDEWEAFKALHSKAYSSEVEEQLRMKIYLENREMIANHNKNSESGYKLEMNKFGDLLTHEFSSMSKGCLLISNETQTNENKVAFQAPENLMAPQEVDWRNMGYVTPVKNQGQCGSCYAFSATGALEGQHMRKYGELVSLSEQNIVDCSRPEGNQGCSGGWMNNAFRYIQKNGGINTEKGYPYEARDRGRCNFKAENVGATCKGVGSIPNGNEKALADAVASVGPISVAIDASHSGFRFYKRGVYYEKNCPPSGINHAVLVVGYGVENGEDYYLVKNSWGENWGDKGYIKMARNRGNNCGIASYASYPIM